MYSGCASDACGTSIKRKHDVEVDDIATARHSAEQDVKRRNVIGGMDELEAAARSGASNHHISGAVTLPAHGRFALCNTRACAPSSEDAWEVRPNVLAADNRSLIPGKQPLHLFAVYDGHGGDAVSKLCVAKLHQHLRSSLLEAGAHASSRLQELVPQALRAAYLQTDEDAKWLPGSGSAGATATVAVISSTHVWIAYCGDSRAIVSSAGILTQTADHKAEREDEQVRIERAGGCVLHVEGAMRVMGVLACTRAIGDHDLKRCGVTAEPEVLTWQRRAGDECLVLASDGLWDRVRSEEAADMVRKVAARCASLPAAAEAATDKRPCCACRMAHVAATALANMARGRNSRDDITVLVVNLKRPCSCTKLVGAHNCSATSLGASSSSTARRRSGQLPPAGATSAAGAAAAGAGMVVTAAVSRTTAAAGGGEVPPPAAATAGDAGGQPATAAAGGSGCGCAPAPMIQLSRAGVLVAPPSSRSPTATTSAFLRLPRSLSGAAGVGVLPSKGQPGSNTVGAGTAMCMFGRMTAASMAAAAAGLAASRFPAAAAGRSASAGAAGAGGVQQGRPWASSTAEARQHPGISSSPFQTDGTTGFHGSGFTGAANAPHLPVSAWSAPHLSPTAAAAGRAAAVSPIGLGCSSSCCRVVSRTPSAAQGQAAWEQQQGQQRCSRSSAEPCVSPFCFASYGAPLSLEQLHGPAATAGTAAGTAAHHEPTGSGGTTGGVLPAAAAAAAAAGLQADGAAAAGAAAPAAPATAGVDPATLPAPAAPFPPAEVAVAAAPAITGAPVPPPPQEPQGPYRVPLPAAPVQLAGAPHLLAHGPPRLPLFETSRKQVPGVAAAWGPADRAPSAAQHPPRRTAAARGVGGAGTGGATAAGGAGSSSCSRQGSLGRSPSCSLAAASIDAQEARAGSADLAMFITSS